MPGERLGDDRPEANFFAEALLSGRLAPPYSNMALGRYLPEPAATAVAGELRLLGEAGTTPRAVALVLGRLAEAAATEPHNLVDLVCSGPEAESVPRRDTAVVVRELFARAERSVVVVGYAVRQGREVFRVLAKRMESLPGLRVRLYLDVQRPFGDTTSASEDILREFARRFRSEEWPGSRLPEVYYDPRSLGLEQHKRSSLHAKCIVVDGAVAFVSSANFTEAAQVRNIEVGVLLRSPLLAERLAAHVTALAVAGRLEAVPGL